MWANSAENGAMKLLEELPIIHHPTTLKRHMTYWGRTMKMTPGNWPVIWDRQSPEDP